MDGRHFQFFISKNVLKWNFDIQIDLFSYVHNIIFVVLTRDHAQIKRTVFSFLTGLEPKNMIGFITLRKWFEPRSNIPWLKKIIWVLLRTPITQMIFFNHGIYYLETSGGHFRFEFLLNVLKVCLTFEF